MPDKANRLSRRRFIASGTMLASGAASLDWTAAAASAPRGFPRGVAVSRRRFENWAQAIEVAGVLTCTPRTPDEVVAVVNWAWRRRYRVRALGRAIPGLRSRSRERRHVHRASCSSTQPAI